MHCTDHRLEIDVGQRPASFARNIRGSVSVLGALFGTVVMICAAIAVDMASLYVERRQAQGAVDLAAIAAAADLDNADAAARATLRANGLGKTGTTVTVVLGNYVADPSISPQQRFTPGVAPLNAAKVTLSKPGNVYFAKAFTKLSFNMSVTGMASNGALAAFSVGSRLAAVRGGLANDLLGALLGSNVSLSVMDYNALVSGDVKLLSFMDALATRLHLTAGTYNQVLTSNATVGDVLAAAASVASADGQSSVQVALSRLAGTAGAATLKVPLPSLISLGPLGDLKVGDPSAGLVAKLNAMELVSGAVMLANGKNQVAVNLAANVPGVLALTLKIAIGEPMQSSAMTGVGQGGSYVRTAQTRLLLEATVGGTGLLAGAQLRLPIYLELANAEARLDSVSCAADGSATVNVATRPGIADVWIGDVSGGFANFAVKPTVTAATIVDVPLIKIAGAAHISSSNMTWTTVPFTQDDIDNQALKQVDTSDIFESLVSSLVGNLKLTVLAGGLGIGLPSPLTGLVASILGGVAAPLDDVVYSILTTLGVHVGEADIRVNGVRCQGTGLLAG